jgi:hypothetical protein
MKPFHRTHRRWIVLALAIAVLGFFVLEGWLAPTDRGGLTVRIAKATPAVAGLDRKPTGKWDLELELRNESGREILLPGLLLPSFAFPSGPKLYVSEAQQPLDEAGRRSLSVWVNQSQSYQALEAPNDRPIQVVRCPPTNLVSHWNTPIRLPATGPGQSIRAAVQVTNLNSIVGITYVPIEQPGPAVIWLRFHWFRLTRRTPERLGGTRASYLELRSPLRIGEVVGTPVPAP